MKNLMEFRGNKVELLQIGEEFYFDPYQVGQCLELSDSAVRKSILKMTERQAVKLTKSIVKDFPNCVIPTAGKLFLTESGVYKLAFRSNKKSAEDFTNWVSDEILPTIRRTGSYSTKPNLPTEPEQLEMKEPYQYHEKYFRGVQVVTIADIAHFSKLNRNSITYYLKAYPKKIKKGYDYFLISGDAIVEFKKNNPFFADNVSQIYLITRSGVEKLAKFINSDSNQKLLAETFPAPKPQSNIATKPEQSISKNRKVHSKQHDPDYAMKMRYLRVTEAEILLNASNKIKDPIRREFIANLVTEILIEEEVWSENQEGFNGITGNFSLATLEGNNKRAALIKAGDMIESKLPINKEYMQKSFPVHFMTGLLRDGEPVEGERIRK